MVDNATIIQERIKWLRELKVLLQSRLDWCWDGKGYVHSDVKVAYREAIKLTEIELDLQGKKLKIRTERNENDFIK